MKRSSSWLTALLQIAILLLVVAFATPWLIAAESPLPIPRHSGDVTLRGHQARPVFNGSVVPGGVYSRDELRRAIDGDPVVADHYRDANVDELRVVTLAAGRAAYVSYRRGDRVHWTRERVWLRAGETVLTDGITVIRARCGNCVSEEKQANVAAVDPAHGELDDFVVPPTPALGVDAFAAEAEAGLRGLLEVPFATEALASLTPGGVPVLPGLVEEPFGGSGFSVVPPIIPPTGGLPVLPGTPVVDVPPTPPFVFVPPGGGIGTPGPGTGSSGNSTGAPGGSSSGTPTGTTSGSSSGSPTSGGDFPTTDGGSSSSGATSAPEPGLMWLVAVGALGLLHRRLKQR